MKFFVFLVASLGYNMAWTKSLDGIAVMWARPVCNPNSTCVAPKQIGRPIAVNLNIEMPEDSSTAVSASKEINISGWPISIKVYLTKVDLLVTQIFLLDSAGQLVAQCTHYDSFAATSHLPVGACSGTKDKNQYGVSIFKAN